MVTTDIVTHRKFWGEAVGLRPNHELDFGNGTTQRRYAAHDAVIDAPEFAQVGPQLARCGDSLLWVVTGAGGSEQVDYPGPHFRYLTIQIFDADDECAAIVQRGGRMAAACTPLGTVAH